MLSPFLQKLDFVHQFRMGNGSIGILGEKQVMLPSPIVSELGRKSDVYRTVKKISAEETEMLMKRINCENKISVLEQVFDTYGLGRIKMRLHGKNATVEIIESPIEPNSPLIAGVIAGMFCYYFGKDLDAHFSGKKGSSATYSIS